MMKNTLNLNKYCLKDVHKYYLALFDPNTPRSLEIVTIGWE